MCWREWVRQLASGRYVFTVSFQLVFQFPAESLADYDAMIALEDQLITVLGSSAQVDGHDCGAGESNIFVFTDHPTSTFELARPSLERAGCLSSVRVGYRSVAGEEYTTLWPEGSTEKFVVA